MLASANLAAARHSTVKDTIYDLPPVLVVGKAVVDEIIIRGNSSSITRISAQQIDDLNAMDLPSALRRVPGVSISRYNLVGSYGGGEGGTIYIRGQGTERPGASIQMIVDGMPMFVGVWTHPLMDLHTVGRLEHIDIFKSPQPVFWGNMSTGAVNMVSRRMRSEGGRTNLTLSGGQEDTYNLVFNHGVKRGRVDYYFGSGLQGSDGHRPKSDGRLRSCWGRIGYQISRDWDLSLITSYSDNWANDPGKLGSAPPKRACFNTEDATLNLTLRNKFGNSNGFIRLFVDDGQILWEQWSDKTDNWFNSRTDWLNRGVRIQQNLLLGGMTQLTLGFDYDSYGGRFIEEHADPANSKLMPEKYFFNTAGYASLQHSVILSEGITLAPSAGVRLNYHSAFDNEIAPEAGLSLLGDRWRLYANYARGFNYAGIYSVWFYNVVWNYREEVYKDLEPERVHHFELGIKYNPLSNVNLDFSLFHDRGSNRIRMIPPPPPPPVFSNVDSYRIKGFEASLNWSPMSRLALFAGLTLLDKTPETLPYSPGYMLTLGGNLWVMERLQLSLDIEAVGERYVANPRFSALAEVDEDVLERTDSYIIANTKLSFFLTRPGLERRGSRVFLAIENLTDTDYEYRPGYPMPGATVFAGYSLDY